MKKPGIPIKAPYVMIPLVGKVHALKILKNKAIAMIAVVRKVDELKILRNNAIAMIPLVAKDDQVSILKKTAIAVVDAGMQKGQCVMPWMIGSIMLI